MAGSVHNNWHCDPLRLLLHKNLSQPWFEPFAGPPKSSLPQSMVLHREGLKHVIRRDVHDRADIWFIKEDGSNFGEVIEDLLGVITGEGFRVLDQFVDPNEASRMVRSGRLMPRPDSPGANELVSAARSFIAEQARSDHLSAER